MSLRSKILLILCVVVVINALADNAVQRFMVEESFVSLEKVEAEKDLGRAVEIIRDEIRDLDDKGRRWASWAPTWRFVYGQEGDYVEDNLGPHALLNGGIDLLYFCDDARKVVWGRVEHPQTRELVALREFASDELPRFPLFRAIVEAHNEGRPVEAGDVTSGLLMTDQGPLLVSTSPILTDAEDEDYRGAVVLGRFLDEALVADIGERVNVELAVWGMGREELPVSQDFVDRVTSEAPAPVSNPIDGEMLHVYATFADMRRIPALLLRAEVPREILAQGRSSVNYALLSTLGTALLILFVLYRLLQRIVLGPLGRLTEHAEQIGKTDDTRRKVGLEDRSDEFGSLAREFDRMLEKLAESRAAHAETARMVGMSEIATGVLHNVGNVLNSVNVSTNLVKKRTEQLKVPDLELLTGILEEHADDLGRFVTEDARGKHSLSFLRELTTALGDQRTSVLAELGNLGEGIEHIIELVRSQQSYAGMTGLYELADVTDLLEQAVKISRQALPGNDDVTIVREYGDVPEFPLDKRKVTEIFVNIVQNARHAMRGIEGEKTITFRVTAEDGYARIEVRDSGGGIAPENLSKIFNHGFTTKTDGHGFGLHTSANAATEMKGKLWAESNGLGQGASFLLELPLAGDSVPAVVAA